MTTRDEPSAAAEGVLPFPVDQTAFKSETTRGNCMQAAVASILGLSLDQVPNFIEEKTPWPTLHKFLNSYGFSMFQTGPAYAPEAFCLAAGMSPRGISHMVVCYGTKVVHDPHPSRGGIEIERKFFLLKNRPWENPTGAAQPSPTLADEPERSEANFKEAYDEGHANGELLGSRIAGTDDRNDGSWETSNIRARLFGDVPDDPGYTEVLLKPSEL